MIGHRIRSKKRKPADWVTDLLHSKFFGACVDHGDLRKNEMNYFCIDCMVCLCKHCVTSSAHDCLHRLLQICKYVYHDVVRLQDIQRYLDCSEIQAYKINGEKAVHLNPRPHLKEAKFSKAKVGGGAAYCKACERHIQDLPNRFCSIACKVSMDTKIFINKTNKVVSLPISEVDDIPSFESECTKENGYDSPFSLTESSEVIQEWVGSSLRRPKMLSKRKCLPRRAPLF
ncbi:protein RGF1 INDUCIBLE TRANSCRIPTION FACTOR 1 [Primulina eburnea]|uniref:protein RGF1 INDUCIBLE TRANSCRIPTION FACTOR 1 n=1 Tax=Primulina eburnea TaxID=1245227 RepID=UPI003C6BD9D4